MKHFKYILLLWVTLFSCQDIFHYEEQEYIVLDTKQKKIDVLNGIYAVINNVHNSDYLKACLQADDINIYKRYHFNEPEGYDSIIVQECRRSDTEPIITEEIIESIYIKLYTAITSLNSVIWQTSENENGIIIGEAYFLRAYCYLKLARFFGTPPIIDNMNFAFTIEKPKHKEVYDFIEKDLLTAINYLPESTEYARIPFETVTKNAAKALLAEVYLSMAGYPVNETEKYYNAAQLAGEVIESGEYALLNDFADLWKENNKYHKENIFGLFYYSNPVISFDEFITLTNINPDYNELHKGTVLIGKGEFAGRPAINNHRVDVKPEFAFFLNTPDNYRKYISLNINNLGNGVADPLIRPCDYVHQLTPIKYFDITALARYVKDSTFYIPTDYPIADGLEYPSRTGDADIIIGYKSNVTLYLLRYAHTLLTFAEAKARIGEMDASAFNAINQVRRRANWQSLNSESEFDLKPNVSQTEFIDSVVWERAWELMMEPDGRWFDIVRLEIKNEIEGMQSDFDWVAGVPDDYLTNDGYFFKLPKHDIDLNPNLE